MAEQEQEEERIVDKRAASRMRAEAEAEAAKEPEIVAGDVEAGAEDSGSTSEGPEDETAALKEQAERFYASWQRSAADFANYKRRMEEERKEYARIANASLVINMLPIFDDLDRAVNTVDAKLAGLNWVQGVEAIHRKFAHVLESMGVKEIPAEGEPFNPELHEAVGDQPGEDGKVLHIAQRGYKLGDKVIRPAMVIIGNGETAPNDGSGAP